jgi:hypothetical protein
MPCHSDPCTAAALLELSVLLTRHGTEFLFQGLHALLKRTSLPWAPRNDTAVAGIHLLRVFSFRIAAVRGHVQRCAKRAMLWGGH